MRFQRNDRVLYEGDIFNVATVDDQSIGLAQITFDNRHPSDDFMFGDPRRCGSTLLMLSAATLAKHQVPWVLRWGHATPIL